MSRKWERMVEKNQKNMNKTRGKAGQAPNSTIAKDGTEQFRGRSWVFPLILASAGLLFGLTVPPEGTNNILYQITVGLYMLLALFHFLIRRPFLKVGKGEISWRTYGGDRVVKAEDIADIQIGESRSIVRLKDGKTKRAFSKVYHMYPMQHVNAALTKFATTHHITVNGSKKES